jgi:hypothetical protein
LAAERDRIVQICRADAADDPDDVTSLDAILTVSRLPPNNNFSI